MAARTYAAIGHWAGSEAVESIAAKARTKRDFRETLKLNGFVPYAVITEGMAGKLHECADSYYELRVQVSKMTTSYRVWSIIVSYIEQCMSVIDEQMANAS